MVEADDFHSPDNKRKMARGEALTDADRMPWLDAVAMAARLQLYCTGGAVIACSSLKRAYRDRLRASLPECQFIHLAGPRALIAERLAGRKGHFVGETLLDSQLATLEPLEAGETGFTFRFHGQSTGLSTTPWKNCGTCSRLKPPPPAEPGDGDQREDIMLKHLTRTALAAIAIGALTTTALAADFSFRFQSSDPAGNPNFELQQGWTEAVKEKTGGRIEIELLPVNRSSPIQRPRMRSRPVFWTVISPTPPISPARTRPSA